MMEELNFRVEQFEGPLDLLLRLIIRNKMDILDIPITPILDQYLEYIRTMPVLDTDSMGEFAEMASELMVIKSRMLLPHDREKPEEDPRADLASALLEYKRIKDAAAAITPLYRKNAGRVAKGCEEIAPDEKLYDQDVAKLLLAFQRMSVRASERNVEEAKTGQTLGGVIQTPPVSIPGKIIGIMRRLYRAERGMTIESLFETAGSRSELVAVFMAILELLRVRRVELDETAEGDITLTLNRERR